MLGSWLRNSLRIARFCAFALSSLTLPALAQFTSGIEGTVNDPSGAAVANSDVSIIEQNTHVPGSARTNDSGVFRFDRLPPGVYRIEVKAAGFKSWIQSEIRLEANQIRTVNPTLEVGEQVATVEVTASIGAVETGRSSVTRSIETQTVETAPLVGRNVYAGVAYLAPGITGAGNFFGGAAGSGSQGTNSFGQEPAFQINAAGQRQEANEYQVDGSSVNGNSRDGIVNLTPEPDTIAEVKVSANVFSAEKGRTSGALIEVYTKSGTNQFHGTASEFHTNNALTSRTVFQDSVPVFRRNEFGGTFGGPIVKDRTFVFGSFFQLLSSQAFTQTLAVETPQFRDYVLSRYPNNLSSVFFQRGATADLPLSNILTAGEIRSSLGSVLTPADIPAELPAVGTVSIPQSPPLNARQWNVRVDHNLRGYRDRIYFNWFRTTSDATVAYPRPLYTYISPNKGIYAKLNWTHTFGANLFNEAWFTYVRSEGKNPGAPNGRDLPNVNITGVAGFNQWGPAGWVHNNFNWHDALSYTRGAHSIRIGFDLDRQQDLDNFTSGLTRPYFNFANILDFAADQPFEQGGIALDVQSGRSRAQLVSACFHAVRGHLCAGRLESQQKLHADAGTAL